MRALSIDRGFVAGDGRVAWRTQSIVAYLPWMAELLCMCNRLWLWHEWLSYFVCAIDCGFVAADGRRLVARS